MEQHEDKISDDTTGLSNVDVDIQHQHLHKSHESKGASNQKLHKSHKSKSLEGDQDEKGASNQKLQESHESFAKQWLDDHSLASPTELRKARQRKAKTTQAKIASTAQPVLPLTPGTCSHQELGCRTMCQWLQLKIDNDVGKCQLFDNQLMACGYAMPEDRAAAVSSPLDCAVELTRTHVREEDVPDYVEKFESCVNGVPAKLNATCSSALGLLRDELDDWRSDKFNENDAELLRKDLEEACAQGRKALEVKAGEQEAIDRLSSDLSKAETIPGHYLVAEEHKARRLLDRLGPIPAVREQLRRAVSDGHRTFKSTSLFRVKEDITWLRVAVQKAEEFKVGPPTAEAKDLLVKLHGLKVALASVKHSVFQANVSLTTKSGVSEAVVNLRDSISQAQAAGLKREMQVEKGLLAQLEQLEGAVISNWNASARGEALLRSHHKGLERLRRATNLLNDTVIHAQSLGLGDNATTETAVATLDKIDYVSHARAALHAAVEASSVLVTKTVSVLSDDEDEAAIDRLENAILWANDAGLGHGVPMAKQLKKRLKVIEAAKEGLSVALAQAKSSWEAKCCAEHAIRLLEAAVKDCSEKGVTAGAAEAQKQLDMLHLLQDARAALGTARDKANFTHATRRKFQNSTAAMEAAINLARQAGIRDKAKIASKQLEKLRAFAEADRELVQALSEGFPQSPVPLITKVEDPQPEWSFNRSGLKPERFPTVVLADDDGDSDFNEHIEALQDALEDGRSKGKVDSDLKAQLEMMRSRRAAYEGLRATSEMGAEALASKKGVIAADTRLTAAVREAEQDGLTLGLEEARGLLGKLEVIQPARDELRAAVLQANASMHTRGSMDDALFRLNQAIKVNGALGISYSLPAAKHLRDQLLYLKKTWVDLTAAITQGEIALESGSGEEAAIAELHRCIDHTDEVNLHGKVHRALDVLHRLTRQNAGKQQKQVALRPLWQQRRHKNP